MRNAHLIAAIAIVGIALFATPLPRSSPPDEPPPPEQPNVDPAIDLAPEPVVDLARPAPIAGSPPAPVAPSPQAFEDVTVPRITAHVGWCASAGCPLTISFDGPVDKPAVAFDPPQAGKFAWTSPTELVFTPDKGAFLAGHRITVKIAELGFEGTVHVPYFMAAGKMATWPIAPGKPRFVAFLNGFVSHLGRGPLFALYDQPIDPADIARGTTVTASTGGKKLGVRVQRPASGEQVFDGAIPLDHVVTLELEHVPPDGEVLTMSLPSRDETGAAVPHTKDLTVNTTLTTAGFVDNNVARDGSVVRGAIVRTPLSASWSVQLSNQVTAKQFAANLRFDPPPRQFRTYVSGSVGTVTASLNPGVLYTLTLGTGISDVLGNKLRAPVIASFRAQDRPPQLVLPDDTGGGLALEHGHMKLPIKVANLGKATMVAQKYVSATAWIASRSGRAACAGDERSIDLETPLNDQTTREVALDPGLYCVSVTAKGRGSEAGTSELKTHSYVQVGTAGVTAKVTGEALFVWATRLSDASPLAGARLTIADANGRTLKTATAAADGTAAFAGTGLADNTFVIVNDGEMVLPLVDAQLSRARQFNLDPRIDKDTGAEGLAAALFTERGVYRPGEKVQLKAIVRSPDTMKPAVGTLEVIVVDPRGEQLGKTGLALDAFGGATHEIALAEAARVGEYTIRAAHDGRTTVRTFRVEEYRVPTFQVGVETDEAWSTAVPTRAKVAAAYLHGGTLAGRELRWELSRTAEPFAPAGWRGYAFDTLATRPPGATVVPESITRGTARLDGQGQYVVPLRPDHASKAGPMRYTVEAAVTDVDRQVYAGRVSRVVHPADFYVGIAAPVRNIYAAGDTLAVPVVAVSPDGAAKVGVGVTMTLERVDYHGTTRMAGGETQRVQHPVATTVRTCTVATAARAVECNLTIPEAGEYVVRAAAADGKRRPVEAAYRISASGPNTVAWPRFDSERITVIADKASYAVGDVARLVIQSPFPKARGLLSIERGGVVEHRLFEINNDTPEVRVPITAAHVPNVFASIVILRGRIHDAVDATGFQTGAPAFRMGYAELRVEPRAHKLDVEVRPVTAKAAPGSTVTVDLAVRDAAGAPREGQATVMVVDEAVLGLTRFKTPDPIAEIFLPRPLSVRTGESRLDLLTSRRSRREQVFPAGDGGVAGIAEAVRDLEKLDLRKLFKSTAYFNAAVPVGADGRARVSFQLPDNVTTYRVMAVVVDKETRAGSGAGSVQERRPLIVQPVLPRFVSPGDKLRLEARAFNGSDAAGTVEVAAILRGATFAPGAPATAKGEVVAGKDVSFAFPIVVPEDATGEIVVRLAGKLGASTDAVEVKLPVVDPGSKRKVVVQRLIAGDDKLVVKLPERVPGTLQVELLASTTALAQLKDAVKYLMTYPNGCIEQTTSTAYPLVVLKDLLPEMGVTVDEKELQKFSEAGVKTILSFQTTSGGLSYWPGGKEPHAFATAFGLTALIAAKQRGYDVPAAALARMADYLEATLRKGTITGEMPHGSMADADTRALFVMTLGRLGRPQAAYISTLWAQREHLTPFGLSFLAAAIAEGGSHTDEAMLGPVLAAIRTAATEEPAQLHYEKGAKKDGGYSMGSHLRTHAGALLAYTGKGADRSVMAKLLTGLLARQRDGSWGNTQENVFGIMAVAQLVGLSSADEAAFGVKVNGVAVDAARIKTTGKRGKRLELREADLPKGAGELQLEVTSGGKPVYATMRVEYVAKLDAASRAPRSAGFAVSRRYETLEGAPLDKKLKLGSLVRVRVRVDAAAAAHYVAIDDKLPAGLEPLNAALATTETVAAGPVTPQLKRTLDRLSHSELRDSRVAFYIDDMPAGSYDFVYLARATTPGTFVRPPASAEAMYRPETSGTSGIDDITIE